ncbi:MAG: AAA family ATPase [Candidatus Aenigmarchaeota archaeon]|nr:AAA family ATPase [Candidatus Aenigmarchaeota archaeon]MCX8190851.1 AAA family ATPase [Candidatus Aenigmarchaeota archaeon]MDW8159853.1 AAA family ATPase [Candidatus Aenigmarchaeota archaeon]
MSVFKQEEVLYPEYLPSSLPHRENQIKLLTSHLELLAKNYRPPNVFIFGPPGVGKTAVVKFVLKEFENYSGIKSIYLNCWQFNTSFSILSEILRSFEIFAPRRGVAKDELFFKMVEYLDKSKLNLVLALDEVDMLIKKDQDVLYDFLRINSYTRQKILLILISNDKYLLRFLEERIRSSLNVEEIEFKPYTFLEMKNIVEERMRLAFKSFENGISALVANYAVERGGDVRVALNILLKAGRLAKEKLTIEDVKNVIKDGLKIDEIFSKVLDERENLVLNVFSQPKVISVAYEEIKDRLKVSERTFRRIIDSLIKKNLLKVIGYEKKKMILSKI